MKSLSEIDTISKRACRGAGFTWGVAEEVGKNTRLLENFGLPGIKNLNDYLKRKTEIRFENLNLIAKENNLKNSNFCPISVGVSFLDQIRTLDNLSEIKFENIGYPLVFLPFVSRASEVIGKRLYLQIDDKEFLLNFNNNIYSNFLKNEIIESSKIILVKFIDNEDSFTENEWKELYELSTNTFVDENESLKRAGAGAGFTDND